MAILRITEDILSRRSVSQLLSRQSYDGGSSTDARPSRNQPFTWVFIPLLAVAVVGTVFAIIYRRRRRRLQQRMGLSSDPQHQGDVESRINGARHARGPRFHGYVQGNRWQQRAGAPGRGRWQMRQPGEDGLNELGEAPPPYVGRKSVDRGDSIEMQVELRRPDPAAFAPSAAAPQLPDYGTAQRSGAAMSPADMTGPSESKSNYRVNTSAA